MNETTTMSLDYNQIVEALQRNNTRIISLKEKIAQLNLILLDAIILKEHYAVLKFKTAMNMTIKERADCSYEMLK